MKKIISWILVIIWLIAIYSFSDMNSQKSNNKSKEVINKAIDTTVEVASKTKIIEKPTAKEKKELINKLNLPVRKITHVVEFFILAIFVFYALYLTSKKLLLSILLCLSLCIFYSAIDEYHQTKVEGRTGKPVDVLIDSIGIVLGTSILSIYYKKKNA